MIWVAAPFVVSPDLCVAAVLTLESLIHYCNYDQQAKFIIRDLELRGSCLYYQLKKLAASTPPRRCTGRVAAVATTKHRAVVAVVVK